MSVVLIQLRLVFVMADGPVTVVAVQVWLDVFWAPFVVLSSRLGGGGGGAIRC